MLKRENSPAQEPQKMNPQLLISVKRFKKIIFLYSDWGIKMTEQDLEQRTGRPLSSRLSAVPLLSLGCVLAAYAVIPDYIKENPNIVRYVFLPMAVTSALICCAQERREREARESGSLQEYDAQESSTLP